MLVLSSRVFTDKPPWSADKMKKSIVKLKGINKVSIKQDGKGLSTHGTGRARCWKDHESDDAKV